VRFPLADWIDAHAHCRHQLASSGMRGTIRHPLPTAGEIRAASESTLRRQLAELVGVGDDRLFLTHGATEAAVLAMQYVRRRRTAGPPRCRVAFPEYPPLVDIARSAGYRPVTGGPTAELAVVSQPRNPTGELWSGARLEEWVDGARSTVVDETFREFSEARSVQRLPVRGLWTTGSFTKVYGADDLRVGFVVAPESERDGFARYHGLVTDEIAPYSIAGALATLAQRDRLLRSVRRLVGRNQALWRRATPGGPVLASPVAFDDPVRPDGDRFARRCLRASVLVCPGSYFGTRSGVRVCLTRRSFPTDLGAYLRVRDRAS
jgi:aspartate/methionine/tyrosine aminotransferase